MGTSMPRMRGELEHTSNVNPWKRFMSPSSKTKPIWATRSADARISRTPYGAVALLLRLNLPHFLKVVVVKFCKHLAAARDALPQDCEPLVIRVARLKFIRHTP